MKTRGLAIAVAFLLAIGATSAVYMYIQGVRRDVKGRTSNMVSVLVSKQDIPAQTNLDNLVSLCAFHHHLVHRGVLRIVGVAGRLRFETRDGIPIGQPPRPARGRPPQPTGSPKPAWPEDRMQFTFAVGIIEDAVEHARAHATRAGPEA